MYNITFYRNMLDQKRHPVSFDLDKRLHCYRVSAFERPLYLFCFGWWLTWPARLLRSASKADKPFSPKESVHSSNQMHGWIIYLSLKDDLLSVIPIKHTESAGGQNLMPTCTFQASSTIVWFPWSIFNLLMKLSRINEAIRQTSAFMRCSGKCYGKSSDKITSVKIPTMELKQKWD